MSLIRPAGRCPREWIVLVNFDLLSESGCPGGSPDKSLDRISRLLSGVRSSCDHIGQELRLVLRSQRQLLGLFLQRELGLLDLAVLALPPAVLDRQRAPSPPARRWSAAARPVWCAAALPIGAASRPAFPAGRWSSCSSSCWACSSGGQQLRLLEQAFRPHVGGDGVEHDPDAIPSADRGTPGAFRMNRSNDASSMHRLTSPSNKTGSTMMFSGARFAQARRDLARIPRGTSVSRIARLLKRALADQALAAARSACQVLALV